MPAEVAEWSDRSGAIGVREGRREYEGGRRGWTHGTAPSRLSPWNPVIENTNANIAATWLNNSRARVQYVLKFNETDAVQAHRRTAKRNSVLGDEARPRSFLSFVGALCPLTFIKVIPDLLRSRR